MSTPQTAAPALPEDLLEPEITSEVETLRHSTAHVMAHAIQTLWPDAKFGIGPTIENGFYYDVDLGPVKLVPEDLKKIEKAMSRIIEKSAPFKRIEMSCDEAIEFFKKLNQPYKIEIIETLKAGGAKTVSAYQEGDFTDLCRGPHIERPGKIKAYKLLSIAGAYWRGSEKNPQLQRIYGTAFLNREELDEHLKMLEEAKKTRSP